MKLVAVRHNSANCTRDSIKCVLLNGNQDVSLITTDVSRTPGRRSLLELVMLVVKFGDMIMIRCFARFCSEQSEDIWGSITKAGPTLRVLTPSSDLLPISVFFGLPAYIYF